MSTVVREGTQQRPFGPAEFVWFCRDLIRLVKLCQTADSHKDCCIIETATITANPGRSRRKRMFMESTMSITALLWFTRTGLVILSSKEWTVSLRSCILIKCFLLDTCVLYCQNGLWFFRSVWRNIVADYIECMCARLQTCP